MRVWLIKWRGDLASLPCMIEATTSFYCKDENLRHLHISAAVSFKDASSHVDCDASAFIPSCRQSTFSIEAAWIVASSAKVTHIVYTILESPTLVSCPVRLFCPQIPCSCLAREFLAAKLATAFRTAPRQSMGPPGFSGPGGFLVPGACQRIIRLNFNWA